MKSCRRRKSAPACRARIVGKMRGVPLMARNGMVPARIAPASRQDQHALQVTERHRCMTRLVGQRTIRNLRPSEETARPPPEQRIHKRKLEEVLEGLLLAE